MLLFKEQKLKEAERWQRLFEKGFESVKYVGNCVH